MISKRKTRPYSVPDEDSNSEESRLIAALKEYEAALASRHPPTRREFLARYASIADALHPCLAGLEMLHKAAKQMRRDAGDPPITFTADLIPLPLDSALNCQV